MEKNYRYAVEPAGDLEDRVMKKIIHYQARNRTVQLWTYGSLLMVSIIGIIPAIIKLMSALHQSGFFQYVSLAFSDGGTVWNLGNEFTLLLAESIPTTSVALSLVLIILFAWSARKIINRAPMALKNYGII